MWGEGCDDHPKVCASTLDGHSMNRQSSWKTRSVGLIWPEVWITRPPSQPSLLYTYPNIGRFSWVTQLPLCAVLLMSCRTSAMPGDQAVHSKQHKRLFSVRIFVPHWSSPICGFTCSTTSLFISNTDRETPWEVGFWCLEFKVKFLIFAFLVFMGKKSCVEKK